MGKRASMTIAANIDAEQLRSLFHMPLAQAATHIGVGRTLFKKICRREGINRWPHMKMKTEMLYCSLGSAIESYEQSLLESARECAVVGGPPGMNMWNDPRVMAAAAQATRPVALLPTRTPSPERSDADDCPASPESFLHASLHDGRSDTMLAASKFALAAGAWTPVYGQSTAAMHTLESRGCGSDSTFAASGQRAAEMNSSTGCTPPLPEARDVPELREETKRREHVMLCQAMRKYERASLRAAQGRAGQQAYNQQELQEGFVEEDTAYMLLSFSSAA